MIHPTDRKLLAALAPGLPLTPEPYGEVARWLGLTEAEVIARLHALHDQGIIRRIAIAPNHYALGMVANGMSVWDVTEPDLYGPQIGALPFVSHCYRRPRAEVEEKRAQVASLLGPACRSHDILYSTRILKKTGMRLTGEA